MNDTPARVRHAAAVAAGAAPAPLLATGALSTVAALLTDACGAVRLAGAAHSTCV
jgi:hypothetical protein